MLFNFYNMLVIINLISFIFTVCCLVYAELITVNIDEHSIINIYRELNNFKEILFFSILLLLFFILGIIICSIPIIPLVFYTLFSNYIIEELKQMRGNI